MAQISNPGGRGKRHYLHLDMTPMVDLAFLLLTFFVLTMTLNEQYVLRVNMPERESKEKQPVVNREKVLTILLGDANHIYYVKGNDPLKTTSYAPDGIRKVLREAIAAQADLVVLIKPTSKCHYQNLIDVLDEVKFLELPHYYLVKETAEDRALIAHAAK